MGLMETIGQVFGTNPTAAKMAVQKAWLDKLRTNEATKRLDAVRLLDWYQNDHTAILEHLKTAAKKSFDPEEIENNWQWVILNGVRRMIDRVSMAYKEPPERKLVRVSENGEEEILPPDDDAYEIFGLMFSTMDLDKKMKEVDRMASLFNTLHLEVVPRDGAIEWDIKLRSISYVVPRPENVFKPARFSYEYNMLNPETLQTMDGWVLWSPSQHVWISSGGREYGLSLNDGSNPYGGRMPIVVVRKQEQDDYWGEPTGRDVVDAFEQLSIQLANMWENGFMQTHGQPFGINLGVPKGTTFRTGPRKPWLVDGVGKDKVPPSLQFVKPETDMEQVTAMLDWYLKNVGSTKGLPPSAWSGEEKATSGFSKMMDNIELLEKREEEAPGWASVEYDAFEDSKMVWNRWPLLNKGKPFPEDVHLLTVFGQVSFPEDPTEEATRVKMEIELGVNSPAHYLAQKKGITLEQAMEEVLAIAKVNQDLRKAKMPEDILNALMGTAQEGSQNPEQNQEPTE